MPADDDRLTTETEPSRTDRARDGSDDEIGGSTAQPSRRSVLAASGALAFASTLGAGSGLASDAETGTAPGTFEAFQSAVADALADAQPVIEDGPYEPTAESLEGVEQVPEWFRDAKFGLYFHWGLYSVPAFETEWYPRFMYDSGSSVAQYHVDNYGAPDEFPYEEFASAFTADAFDAEEWAALFDEAGARFAGPIAEHHDGWSNWDSAINPWNAGDRGSQRDITGELESAIRDRDIRFITTFHHARRGLPWDEADFSPADPAGAVGHYSFAYENFPSVTEGYPERVMYANTSMELFLDTWLAKLVEVVGEYDPDLVWFDNAIETVPDEIAYGFLAYYYNHATENEQEVAVTRKQDDLPLSMSIEDFEKGRPREMQEQAWLTDTTLSYGAWSYTQNQSYKPVYQVVHTLADIVSKNGQMLLNISPRADGTIPDVQRERLQNVGEWLDVNGDAIYETRPWEVFGEGPTRLDEGGHFVGSVEYTPEDVRYTQSKDGESLFATVLGWPGDGEVTLQAVKVDHYAGPERSNGRKPGNVCDLGRPGEGEMGVTPDEIPPHAGSSDVTLLGHGAVDFDVDDDDRITIDVPSLSESERPSDYAIAFELSGFELSTQPADLAIGASDVATASAGADTITVTATVHNEGYSTSPETSVQFREVKDGGGTELGSRPLESLAARGSTTLEFEWDVSDREAGLHEIAVVVDPDDELDEIAEGNNEATTTVALPLIDLAGEWRFHTGDDPNWKSPSLDDGDWELVEVPANWEDHSDYTTDQVFGWYRTTVTVPASWEGRDLEIPVGTIDDIDQTFLNGEMIGQSGEFPGEDGEWCCANTWQQVRRYTVPSEVVNFGEENVIAIRVFDGQGGGGLYGGPLGPVTIADE